MALRGVGVRVTVLTAERRVVPMRVMPVVVPVRVFVDHRRVNVVVSVPLGQMKHNA